MRINESSTQAEIIVFASKRSKPLTRALINQFKAGTIVLKRGCIRYPLNDGTAIDAFYPEWQFESIMRI